MLQSAPGRWQLLLKGGLEIASYNPGSSFMGHQGRYIQLLGDRVMLFKVGHPALDLRVEPSHG
jgi:hypothetical protein